MSNTKHKHADILIAIANGEQIQSDSLSNGWCNIDSESVLYCIVNEENIGFRVKPKTININGFEVPEPFKSTLNMNQAYYVPSVHSSAKCQAHYSCNDDYDKRMIDSGLAHLTKEAAIIHSEALLSFTKGK